VAIESPLEIRLGHDNKSFQTLAITMCSPEDIEDLIYGYLYTEHIITKIDDVKSIKSHDNELGFVSEVILNKSITYEKFLNKRNGLLHASCGVCGKTEIDDLLTFKYPYLQANQAQITMHIIQSLPQKLRQHQQAYAETGGLHASALFNHKGDIMAVKEDIGRHNALDKLIGCALKKGWLPLNNSIILLSGRVSFELVHKSLMAGLSTLAAIGAPSSLSVEIARLNHLNLFGFVKLTGLNQY